MFERTILAGTPTSLVGSRFLDLLSEDEMAFDILYCVAFQMLDAQWLAKRASYMQFNVSSIQCYLLIPTIHASVAYELSFFFLFLFFFFEYHG